MRSDWNLSICKDILKGILIYNGRPLQIKDLTCPRGWPSSNIYCSGQIFKYLMPKLAYSLGRAWESSFWSPSSELCNIAWCFTSNAPSLCSSFSCSSTKCIAQSCICDKAATCLSWACSSLTWAIEHPLLPLFGQSNYYGM